MSVPTIRPSGRLGSEQTGSEYSRGIWADIPIHKLQSGEVPGILFEQDFARFPTVPPTTEGAFGEWSGFSSTGGTMTAGTGQGGELVLASDDDNEGASIRTVATPFLIARTAKLFAFEARIKVDTIADTKNGVFCGLMENTALTAVVPITAAGALADVNLVGFHRLEGDGDYFDTVYKANGVTQVTVQSDAALIAADTYVKLGMVYRPETDPDIADVNAAGVRTYNLTFYKNGIPLSTRKQIPVAAGTDFPNDVGLGFVLAILNATGTTPGNVTIDKLRIAQFF